MRRFLEALAVNLNAEDALEVDQKVGLVFPDLDDTFTVWIRRVVVEIREERIEGLDIELGSPPANGRQAAALAAGDVSAFGLEVTTTDLDPSVTRRAGVAPGYYERVYISEHCIDNGTKCDGIDYDGVPGPAPAASAFGQTFQFLGHRQPYGLYVPEQDAPHGLQLAMHGYSANHTSLISFGGMQSVMGEGA